MLAYLRTFLVLSLCLASAAWSAEVKPSTTIAAYDVARIVPGESERVFVIPIGPPTPRKFQVIPSAAGEQCLFGEPGEYLVLWFREGSPEQGQFSVTITQPGPGPVPPPPPPGPVPPPPGPTPPDLDDVARRLLPKFQEVNDKPSAARLLAATKQFQQDLETIKSVQVAGVRWREINSALQLPSAWKPAIAAIVHELNSTPKIEDVRTVVVGILSALEQVTR